MSRRLGILAIALAMAATDPPAVEGQTAAKTWCMTYCDVVHVGCTKTFGWLDPQACDDWHAGCLDGCRVND